MKNAEIARILYEMADILEMQGVAWKPLAYRKAARSIETSSTPIEDIYAQGGRDAIRTIPGIGEGIAKKVEEFIKTGDVMEYRRLEKSIPKGVEEMMHVPSLGAKKAVRLHKELRISGIKQLEAAAKAGRIRKLAGFGEKSEQDILRGIALLSAGEQRKLLGTMLPLSRLLEARLQALPYVKRAIGAGSIRRRRETAADIDVLVISAMPGKIMDYFTTMPEVKEILAKGPTKSAVILEGGMQADVRVLEDRSFGAALQYFTGNKDHNVKLRQIAMKKGFKLSEYGLFNAKTGRYVAGRTEEDVYAKLGLQYIEPELRENLGEIDLAAKRRLPEPIAYDSLQGDLHMHTQWSDGAHTVEQMARAAMKLGYSYIAITDHSKSERVANGMDEKRLSRYVKELDAVQRKLHGIRILKGAEVDILADGSLDYGNAVLKKLDVVVAAIHSRFKATAQEQTQRLLTAMENPHVTILAHPTGRLINQREPYELDFERVFAKAKERGILLEINAFPQRLDLKDLRIKQAMEAGCKFVINTDSHATDHLQYAEYGIAQARRGWLTKRHVINTLPLGKLEKFITR